MKSPQRVATAKRFRISVVDASEQERRLDQVISRRAYEIFERRGGTGWHELEDWRTAESEIRSNLCVGKICSGGFLLADCDISGFAYDSVEIWLAPRQLTLCGKRIRPEKQAPATSRYQVPVFRVAALPVEIDPRRAFTTVRQGFLEIHMPIVRPEQKKSVRGCAA